MEATTCLQIGHVSMFVQADLADRIRAGDVDLLLRLWDMGMEAHACATVPVQRWTL